VGIAYTLKKPLEFCALSLEYVFDPLDPNDPEKPMHLEAFRAPGGNKAANNAGVSGLIKDFHPFPLLE